jgi:hypothetical protein
LAELSPHPYNEFDPSIPNALPLVISTCTQLPVCNKVGVFVSTIELNSPTADLPHPYKAFEASIATVALAFDETCVQDASLIKVGWDIYPRDTKDGVLITEEANPWPNTMVVVGATGSPRFPTKLFPHIYNKLLELIAPTCELPADT